MKKITYSVFIFFLFLHPLFANEALIQKKKAPLSVSLPLLKSIDHHAIVLGTGPINMYAFIDPLCPRSQDFVAMIVESKKMRERYTYYFFYYELKRFKTQALIAKIYANKVPLEIMKKIMIDHIEVKPAAMISKKIQQKIDDISKVALELDIYKRPYLFVVKPKKGNK